MCFSHDSVLSWFGGNDRKQLAQVTWNPRVSVNHGPSSGLLKIELALDNPPERDQAVIVRIEFAPVLYRFQINKPHPTNPLLLVSWNKPCVEFIRTVRLKLW